MGQWFGGGSAHLVVGCPCLCGFPWLILPCHFPTVYPYPYHFHFLYSPPPCMHTCHLPQAHRPWLNPDVVLFCVRPPMLWAGEGYPESTAMGAWEYCTMLHCGSLHAVQWVLWMAGSCYVLQGSVWSELKVSAVCVLTMRKHAAHCWAYGQKQGMLLKWHMHIRH